MYSRVSVPVTLILVLYYFGSSRALDEAPSCRDLRDEQNELACNKKAYRAWLSAGKELSNLGDVCFDDLVELPKKCNLTEDFEEKLALSEQHMNQPLLKALKEHLNEPVIQVYRETHQDEPALHLGNRKNGNCCQSLYDFPIQNITDNLIENHAGAYLEYLGSKEKDPTKVPFEVLEEAIGFMLSDYVFRPCGRYLHVQDDMFLGQLKGSVKKFMNNDWSFLQKQSEEFRSAVFRYQFCSHPHFKARLFDDHYDFWNQDDFYDGSGDKNDSDSDDESKSPIHRAEERVRT